MHSNERGECCPRTLVDRKRKRYDKAIDVVVRLHDLTDPSTELTVPPSSAHVQLDDVPRTPIQQSFTGEFRQHDGVMTVMMLPKHRYDMIEVDYGGGGHRTRLGTINLCVLGCPLPPYIKEQGGRLAGLGARHRRAGPPPPPLLYIRGRGAPHRHTS